MGISLFGCLMFVVFGDGEVQIWAKDKDEETETAMELTKTSKMKSEKEAC